MDQDIEGMVKRCEECQTQQASPPHAPLQPWKWPTRPWARLHVDLAGPSIVIKYMHVVAKGVINI